MEETNSEITGKIHQLVENAQQYNGMEFRLALEELVKGAEEEAEYVIVHYLTDKKLNPETRMDIIRVAGYFQRPAFLVPLKKIIDTEQHSRIQKGAIVSVAKYNDRRALNILNSAFQKLKNNPLLMSTINNEISRIKENNPILALMPRFQEGSKNSKTFNVALDILKRILTPSDATVFTKFLSANDPLVQKGAFEILCITGDIFHDEDILGYYQRRFEEIPCLAEKECNELYMLTHHIRQYLTRYQFLIEEQVPNMIGQYGKVTDIRVRQLLLSVMCKSKENEAMGFIRETYEQQEDVRASIIGDLAGNETATGFLFDLYNGMPPDDALREPVIITLLTLKEGLAFFVREFFTLSFEDQLVITQNLPYAGQHDLVEFIKQIFQSDIYRLKEILLSKVKETYEFSVKDLLFEPEKEREFYFMGDEYFDTVTRLFPLASLKRLLTKVASPEESVSKTKKYLTRIGKVLEMELLININNKKALPALFNKIIKSNNKELNVQFLEVIKNFRTLDPTTYQNLREALGLFITQRQTNLSPEETGALNRIKRSLNDLFYELKRLHEGKAAMERMLKAKSLDFETLTNMMKTYQLTVVMNDKKFFAYLADQFKKCTTQNVEAWTDFLGRFPKAAGMIKPSITDKLKGKSEIEYGALLEMVDSLSGAPPRLVLMFNNRHFTAVLQEQFAEAAPHIALSITETQLRDTDTLLTDAEALRDRILQGKLLPAKIYLFLEELAGFSDFKVYNPRNFVKPFVYYRIVKEILQEIYS